LENHRPGEVSAETVDVAEIITVNILCPNQRWHLPRSVVFWAHENPGYLGFQASVGFADLTAFNGAVSAGVKRQIAQTAAEASREFTRMLTGFQIIIEVLRSPSRKFRLE
jgi:hypothetical protein